MKTRERIIQVSKELFNERGERKVTTNHIASHLGISPGNLYYHFKNKQQIIFDIYLIYEKQVDDRLQMPVDRPLTINDKLLYLKGIFQGLWDYRFIHRDLQHLLEIDEDLHKRYNDFFKRCLSRVQSIYMGLRDSGIISASDKEVRALALNTWILVTSWFGFMHTNLLVEEGQEESLELLHAGIYQIFALESPYLTEQYREPVSEMIASLGPSLEQIVALP
ncbi:MAG: AcrR family transcriptional regulator [Bermanella sp.]|jgi:AcrR family transcriptional regulator